MSDREFIERVREAYQPGPEVGAGLEARLREARAERPRRTWFLPAGALVAAAAALFLWLRPTPVAPTDDSVEVAALALALVPETEVESEVLPDEYAVLADVWEEESNY